MKQTLLICQNGKVRLSERDLDNPSSGFVRIAVKQSGISPGTELLGLERSADMDGEFPMGYQAAGVIDAAGADLVDRYKPGDRVACYGAPYVHHASHLNVPQHLVTPLPDSVDISHASFCGLASVALHGFRQTGCTVGETVAIIGLGLLGNLAAQCALAAGCRVVASELLPKRVTAAKAVGLEIVPNIDTLQARIAELTAGHGADAIMLGVKNTDDALLAEAYKMVRRLGKIVILGLSDAQLPRELMFSKEATVMVSRAAGWGRYNSEYESAGRDFPYEHARWTEGRNLEEAIRLMSIERIKIDPLLTDNIPATECVAAYHMLKDQPAHHLAVTLRW